jgi:hypothetical protein
VYVHTQSDSSNLRHNLMNCMSCNYVVTQLNQTRSVSPGTKHCNSLESRALQALQKAISAIRARLFFIVDGNSFPARCIRITLLIYKVWNPWSVLSEEKWSYLPRDSWPQDWLRVRCRLNTRGQSHDFGIYNYNTSVVVCRLERFSKQKEIFLVSKR